MSFFLIGEEVMSIAFAGSEAAAYWALSMKPLPGDDELPGDPAWVAFTGAAVRGASNLPSGTRAFASALGSAELVTIGLSPAPEGFQAALRSVHMKEEDARESARQLTEVTDTLARFIRRAKQTPNPADLSGVLTAGVFRHEGRVVHGTWPIERAFLETLSTGRIE